MAVDISPFIKDAQSVQDQTGIPASIILGQIMLESGGKYSGGLSGLAVQGKNLFGIKGTGPAGSVLLPTSEVLNGVPKVINAHFRKYNSYTESILDHAKVLSLPRYATKIKDAKNVNEYAAGIKAGGYATDPDYVSKLVGVISSNNLHQYDKEDMTFKPITGESGESSSSESNDFNMFETIFFHTVRALMVVGIFILMIVFFLKAFPVTSDAADVVASTVNPVKKLKGGKRSKGGKKANG